jgi:hypothetical protein
LCPTNLVVKNLIKAPTADDADVQISLVGGLEFSTTRRGVVFEEENEIAKVNIFSQEGVCALAWKPGNPDIAFRFSDSWPTTKLLH